MYFTKCHDSIMMITQKKLLNRIKDMNKDIFKHTYNDI